MTVPAEPVRPKAAPQDSPRAEPVRAAQGEANRGEANRGRREPVNPAADDGWNGPFPSFLNAVIGGYE
ncbi:hypothetical protein QP162_03075 [Sphingomonas aurantiaca]|uniref:hypothetical protein n=1 Tax=Sphingomonas aurantiaca TaxID=185949 RepID=UPI002FE200AD